MTALARPFDQAARRRMLAERAATYADNALDNALTAYPVYPLFIATGPESFRTHRDYHPAFFGSFDWHSCVEMHWVAVRLSRLFPEQVAVDRVASTLSSLLTPANIEREIAFFEQPEHATLERPYGWGWLFRLAAELHQWNHPVSSALAAAVDPLAHRLITRLVEWLPRLPYPQRVGNHPNTAFGLSCALILLPWLPGDLASTVDTAIRTVADRFYRHDIQYPAHYEPSGADFLSAALAEAELMRSILSPDEFLPWLDRFLPGLAQGKPDALFTPATVTDSTDGQIAHLHGLNLSRAWMMVRIAEVIPVDDPRQAVLLDNAVRHTEASLQFATGSDYMVEHWLSAYATLLLSE